MPGQPGHDLPRIIGQGRDEIGIVRRRALETRARLRELLPAEQPEPVAERIEIIALENAAAPDAQDGGVRALRETEEMLELLRARHPVEGIDRDPVPAAHEDAFAVDDERVRKRVSRGILVRYELYLAKVDVELAGAVEPLLAGAVRPPELRLLDFEQHLPVE